MRKEKLTIQREKTTLFSGIIMYVSYFPIGLGDHSPRIDCGRDFVEKPRSTRSVTSVIIMLLPSGVLTTYAEKLSL